MLTQKPIHLVWLGCTFIGLALIEKDNYLNVHKQENDDWKLYANIWNTSAPQ